MLSSQYKLVVTHGGVFNMWQTGV